MLKPLSVSMVNLICRQPAGVALVMTLMLIAVLTIAGSTAVTISSTDLFLGGAFYASQIAFHNADAGVYDVISRIPH